MNNLLKGSLVVGGVAAAGALWRAARPASLRRYEPWERAPYANFPNKVLIVGGGFAGYAAAKRLCGLTKGRDDIGVMVVNRENFMTFWPMATGIISSDMDMKNIAQPLRRNLIRFGASFRWAELECVDLGRRFVVAGGQEIPYDHLVLALGAQPAYFGIPGVEEHSISMSSIADAERIRNRVIQRYEEVTLDPVRASNSKLTFVVIGGGATGVGAASKIWSLVHRTLEPDFPNIDPQRVRIILIDSNKEILRELDPTLRRAARLQFAERRVEVLNEVRAREVTADRVILGDGREIETENVVWTAGGRASVKLEDLGLPYDERKGLTVDACMRVEGHDNVWGIGDCAANVDENGNPVPPNAQAAVQEGEAVAENILASIDGGKRLSPLRYRPVGHLVDVGKGFAVNEVMGVKFSGTLASLVWRGTYLFGLESPQSRTRGAIDWFLDVFSHSTVTEVPDR